MSGHAVPSLTAPARAVHPSIGLCVLSRDERSSLTAQTRSRRARVFLSPCVALAAPCWAAADAVHRMRMYFGLIVHPQFQVDTERSGRRFATWQKKKTLYPQEELDALAEAKTKIKAVQAACAKAVAGISSLQRSPSQGQPERDALIKVESAIYAVNDESQKAFQALHTFANLHN